MSHTVTEPNGEIRFINLTIQNYTLGGEAVAIADINSGSGSSLVFLVLGTVAPADSSLGVPLFPTLESGKIKLYRLVSGVPTEVPTTTALNAKVFGVVKIG